ncbi:Rieske (2Fe-2S) protein [Denitromonas ohlonensis]|uniref:Rieske 2Fe-2S domain-containing protein n=2 Tax=Denitromonas TaxID=139331 RepID=A0A557REN4_9RHOO|nr:Rieske 2Fe-2S domain-containing protein [Denitromonas ohlonensis]TVO63603.1 Rieske 2Fe-2S domain-containing protein [Denitromonas ohlonensis]TVO74137.1 Rieske 2Fe-2S domain-containing protein [Denitromonas ohlonensis]
MRFIDVCAVQDVTPDQGRPAIADGKSVALFQVGGTIHALDNACPHGGAALSGGAVCGRHVTCRAHGWRFDVTTGELAVAPAIKVAKHPVRIDGDRVLVGIHAQP